MQISFFAKVVLFLTLYCISDLSNKNNILRKVMNCTDLEKLGAEMESPFAKEWDKKNNCKDTVYSIELVA